MTARRVKPFTPEEDARLTEMRLAHPGHGGMIKIARELGRPYSSVKSRLLWLADVEESYRHPRKIYSDAQRQQVAELARQRVPATEIAQRVGISSKHAVRSILSRIRRAAQ